MAVPAGHKIECRFVGLLLKHYFIQSTISCYMAKWYIMFLLVLMWIIFNSTYLTRFKKKERLIEIAKVTERHIQNTITIHLNHKSSKIQ